MSNELKDYGQLFCEAVDTIVKERLSGIKFDSTILCTIVDDKDKAQGKYIVAYSDAKFEAYAMGETKYNKNNNVYVQIPGGDWNEQKFIIAKKTNEEDTPVTYQYPFDSFVDITGNIIKNTPKVEGSLIANGYWDMSDPDDIQVLTGEDEQLIWAYNIEGEDIVNSEWGEQFSKYTRLGIQAQFQSWLAEDNAVSGSYGLRLRVEAEKADAADIETDEEYEEPETEIVYYDFVLDSADMVGNPYAFDTYFQQEKLFDIVDIYRINKMQLQFYQKGDFKQSSGEVFPTYEDENLFVKDVYISLGYDANEFENDTVSIYSLGSPSYDTKADPGELNHRELNVRWIHRMPNDIIKAVDEKDDINYTITWYKYRLGVYSYTPQSGADWIPLSEQIVEWKTDELGKRVKVVTLNILDEDWKNYNLTAEAGYVRQPEFNKTWLIPDITLAEENIKVIISYKVGSQQIYVYSDSLTFKNRQEVVSKPTVDAVSALSIVCEDGSFGNYRIYNQGNELINPAEGATERTFKAYFKGAPLANAESIEWIIPTENSMIVLENNYYAPDRTWDDTGRVSMKRYGDKSKKWDISQSNDQRYKIKRYYAQEHASNTIQCKVVKDKITYTAVKELTFGPAGTSGSDYTLILDFDDGFTAIPFLDTEFLKNGKPDADKVKSALVQESYGITARLYDFENKEINFENNVSNFTIEWDFYVAPTSNALSLSAGWKTERKMDEDDPTKEIITKIDDETGCKQRLNIDYSKLDINTLYIVQATLRWRGEQPVEGTEIIPQVLTAYLSIPIYRYLKDTKSVIDEKTGEEIAELIIQPSFIGGAKQVIYMSNGLPNYYKNAYQIFYNEYNELEDKTLFVENTDEWNENISWHLIGQPELDNYSPECDRQNANSLIDCYNKLKPSSIYIKNANPYGIQCKRKRKDKEVYDVIWTQPIFVTMNRYPNSMINKWDGKTLKIENETGSILATAIAAGKKETWTDDNNKQQTAFTGVMLGDWSSSTLGDIEESLVQTGIYGFHRGEQSFAFTEDGKAFIGKSGRGRIHLDGDNGSIYSSSWDIDNDTININHGMHLDIDDGHIAMYRNDVYQRYNLSKNSFNANSEDVFVWKDYQILLNHPTNFPVGTTLYTPASFEKDNNINGNNYVNYKYYEKVNDDNATVNSLTLGQFSPATGKKIEYTDTEFSQLKTLIDENYYNFTSDILDKSILTSNKKFSVFCYDINKSFIGQLKYNSSNQSFYLGKIAIDLTAAEIENLNHFIFNANIKTIVGEKINKLIRKETEDGHLFTGVETEENKAIEKKIAYVRISINASDEAEININSNITVSINNNIVASVSGKIGADSYKLIKQMPSAYSNIYAPSSFVKSNIPYKIDLDLSSGMYYIELKKYITLKEAKKYNSNLVFDAKETYYRLGDSYYIDLGVDEEKIPLSIGTSNSKSSRNFYVEWDGTLHAKNGLFEGTIESSIIKGGYIEAVDIVGKSTITGATINGGTINGAQIYFGEGTFYLYRGSDGTELKTANNLGTTFTAAGVTYSLVSSKSAEKAGYLGYSQGSYNLDGTLVASGVLVLDSTISANNNVSSNEETLPIVIRSNDRVLIYSQNSWAMLQTKGGKIQLMADGSVWFKDGAADATKQHGIYARFA